MKPGGWFSFASVAAIIAMLVLSCCGATSDEADAPLSDARAQRLTEQLQRGGNVLLLRHALTDRVDMSPGFEDCARERYLSARGRRQARTIQQALRELDVSVERVMTSPLCQAVETGSLVTGSAFASRSLLPPALLKTVLKPSDSPDYSLSMQIASNVDTRSNAVLVSHRETIAEATGAKLDEGDTLIIVPAPFDEPEYRVAARLTPSDWTWLANR